MVRLTPEHWDAVTMRHKGCTYADIASVQGCTFQEARDRVQAVVKVLQLRLMNGLEYADGEDVSG